MGTCNNCVTLVVKNTGKDLVGVALQDLKAGPRLNVPQSGRLVCAGSQDPAALRAEADLRRDTVKRAHLEAGEHQQSVELQGLVQTVDKQCERKTGDIKTCSMF